jgi:hypothetical protein
MNLLRLSAVTIALTGFGIALADESARTDRGLSAKPAAGAREQLWSEFDDADSLLLPQVRAVFAALSSRKAAADDVEVEAISVAVADPDLRASNVSNAGNCKHLPLPNSRFMTERCFYQSEGQKSLDDYQYRMEIIQTREQNDRDFVEVAEYGLTYRRSMLEQ